ncbi:uncharacterized protein N7506_003647 [Penicillium brevicompactum]|uniref:uncharacterized protein n=1 Tax=Penicillium brevicompactum TaxID=5074 RepID=UPI002540B28B|nr:uncharacterized protein N7506_003647 [Penicillium brevicompactum]KAJ5343823.1 hypothetical protein N7506_003647 [Penicillium brevicompactum]
MQDCAEINRDPEICAQAHRPAEELTPSRTKGASVNAEPLFNAFLRSQRHRKPEMAITPALGRVASLFPHIEKDWWKKAYNELYLYTDGDCVEVPVITEAECTKLLEIPSVQQLLQTKGSPVEVLDLCCGQGRHSIHLAKRFPDLKVLGVDQSTYLLGLAKHRALAENAQNNTNFREGDLRQIPTANGGIFVIDCVDGSWIRSNFSKSGWEWLEGEKKLLACRERELSPDQTQLASREIVIDLDGPSIQQDLFYSVRLYDLEEMEGLLQNSGLRVRTEDGMQLITPQRDGTVDMGMMERRQFVVAQKSIDDPPPKTIDHDARVYVHPSLELGVDEHKGKLIKVSSFVPAGTKILADTPYGVVPSLDPSQPDSTLCSNLGCNRLLSSGTESVRCSEKCIRDVAWCNDHCRVADQDRHGFECDWLKSQGEKIREKEGQYDFAMLWLVVRLVAGKHLQMQNPHNAPKPYAWEVWFKRGWESIESLTGNLGKWPETKMQHWKRQVEEYLSHINRLTASVDELVGLICREESNSFGLYPRKTGSLENRGTDYGMGVYPRASLVNHSCDPNLYWGPDSQGNLVLTTSRDLTAGEECFICYLDISEYGDPTKRERVLREGFHFSCACEICVLEQANAL